MPDTPPSSTPASADRPRRRGQIVPMAPADDPADASSAVPARTPRSRRRVYATRGLAASAAVLALSMQAGQAGGTTDGQGDDNAACSSCGDAGDAGDAGDPGESDLAPGA